MSGPGAPAARGPRWRWALAGVALLLLAALVAAWLLQPPRAVPFLLSRLGASLGLEIRAGAADYRLRDTPQLEVRGLDVRQPGAATPLLRARRALLVLPWSSVRARGATLTAERIELDAPVLDLDALRRWLATRPPSAEPRVPTLTRGLRVRDGTLAGGDWRIEGLALDVPALFPDRPLRARLRGRYVAPPLRVPVDLAIAVAHPLRALSGAPTGVAAAGALTVAGEGWTLPAQIFLAGAVQHADGDLRLAPARLGLAARYRSDSTDAPFRLGLAGTLAVDAAGGRFAPVRAVLDGKGAVPDARAGGSLAFGPRLALQVEGSIAAWPDAWPALPPPLSSSRSPLPFALGYAGPYDFSATSDLELRRDGSFFASRFRLPAVLAWIDAGATGSPLPPLSGRLSTPRVEIGGATLEGVEVDFEDPAVPADAAP